MSCAERIADAPDNHSVREIFNRINADLIRTAHASCPPSFLRFRIVFVSRRDNAIVREITFVSPARELNPKGAA